MPQFETVTVDQITVACDGGGGVGGHPRVFLNLAPAGAAECPYCSRSFVLRRTDAAATAPRPVPKP